MSGPKFERESIIDFILAEAEADADADTQAVVLTTPLKRFLFPKDDGHVRQRIGNIPVKSMTSWQFGFYLERRRDKGAFHVLSLPKVAPVEEDIIESCLREVVKHIYPDAVIDFRECVITCYPDGYVRQHIHINSLLFKAVNDLLGIVVTDFPKNGGIHFKAYYEFRKAFDSSFEESGNATIDKKTPLDILRAKLMTSMAVSFALAIGEMK